MNENIEIEKILIRLDSLEKSEVNNKEAHKDFYKRIGNLDESKVEQSVMFATVNKNLDRLEKKVDSLLEIPQKKAIDMKYTVIASIISGIIMLVVGKLI